MKIRIAAWRSEALEGTRYVNGQMLTGTEATAPGQEPSRLGATEWI